MANLSENVIANALGFAGYNSDIISNSWGTSIGGGTFFSTPSKPTIKTMLSLAALNGRNGRGNVIVFCTHNDGKNKPRDEASLNIKGLISVGASDINDNKPPYSNFGIELDIVAPSGSGSYTTENWNNYSNVWTIDIPNQPGSNPWHSRKTVDAVYEGTYLPSSGINYEAYTGRFGGTSASAPQVSGVAALMLSLNPCLTAPEVETIIKRNADKVGGYNYNWSSAAPGHSKEFGYGRLNANRALIDLNFEQNKNYTSNYKVKAGSLHAGYSVTNQTTNGNVVVKTGKNVEYLATVGITLDVGFEVEGNATFSATVTKFEVNNCYNWDQIPLTLLDQQSLIADAQLVMKPQNNKSDNISLNNLNTKARNTENFNIESTNKINFYPNPNVDNSLKISFEKGLKNNAEILIYNTFGELMLKQVILNESKFSNVDLSKFASGIYTIVVSYDGLVINKRIVKL